ncbi:MAG: hypothetical protein OEZ36_08145, partial [Spirochaetota bacterium]|nr:hypothetical protein [Spirochaetota bacterium]
LLRATNFMVENSWKNLNRTSYNVIITFSRFLKHFIQEGNIFALQDPVSVFNKMGKYIIPYLQVASKRVNKDLLKESFYETLYFEAAFKADFREIIHVVNELLDIDSRGMRFFNVILGIFMIQYRHFVSLPHMLNHYNVGDIEDSHYDFSPKIKGQIQEEIESGSYKFTEMEEALYYLRYIDEGFNFGAPLDNPVVQIFGRVFFYTRVKPPMSFEKLVKGGDFHDEAFLGSFKANITPVLYNYLIGFLTVYGSFLRGQVSVKGKDKLTHEVSLFSNWYFGKELEELANYQSELGALKDATTFLSIPFETYERFNRSGRIDLEKEERLCRHFQNVVGFIYKLSEKMANALYRHFASSNLTGDEKLALENSKNDPIDDVSLDARLIPHATSHIARDPYLDGQLIINVMNEIMVFSANFANLFRYADLSDRLTKKQKQLLKSEEYLKLKSKLAD